MPQPHAQRAFIDIPSPPFEGLHLWYLGNPSSPSYIGALIKVVDTWQQHFAQVGVSEEDIESLALRIDGEGLLGQRRLFGN